MPQQLSYPGVYVEEIPSGVRTISNVSTSVAVFIDFFKEGPLDKAVQIFGMTDFGRIFGGLDNRSEASYAISQFFLNGGTEAYVIRVAGDDTILPASSRLPLRKAAIKILAADGSTEVLQISAINQGVWGNALRVDIDHETSDPAKLFNLTVTRYDSDSANARPITSETFLSLGVDTSSAMKASYVETVVNEGSKLVTVKHLSTSSSAIPAMSGTVGGNISVRTQPELDGLSGKKFNMQIGSGTIREITLDTWGAGVVEVGKPSQLRARIEKAIRSADATDAAFSGAKVDLITMTDGKAHLRVRSGKAGTNYSPNELVKITTVTGDQSAKTRLELTTNAAPDNAFENVQEYQLGLVTSPPPLVGALKPLSGSDGVGADGDKPGPGEIIGSSAVEPHTGMFALDYVDLFNIMCIPRAAKLDDVKMTAVISNAIICAACISICYLLIF